MRVSGQGSWAGVAFGIGIASFAAYHQFKLAVVLPLLLARYDYERTLAGGFVAVYAVAGLLLSMWMGNVVRQRGPMPPVYVALVLMAIGTLVTLLLPESGWLVLAGRALEGVAFAALAVSGPVIANANAPARQLTLVIGLTAAWIPIGQLSATVLAQIGVERFGWAALWWVGIALCVVIAAAAAALVRNPRVSLGAAPASTAGGSQGGLVASQRLTLVLVGVVFMLWSGQYFAFMTLLPQYLVEVQGIAVRGALLGYVLPVSFVILFCLVTGLLMRMGVALGELMIGSLTLQAMVWWMLPYAATHPVVGTVCLVAYGASAGVVPTCLFAMPNAVVGGGRGMAPAFGIIMTGRNLGVLVGPVLLAWLAGLTWGWSGAQVGFALVTSVATGIGVVIALRLSR